MMRIILFLFSVLITTSLVILLNNPLKVGSSQTPPLGNFFSPQHGFWKNAEPINTNFSESLHLKGLLGPVEVFFDERLVPHVYADNEDDVYFVQGFLHAKFRLWQMEFQTHVAAGRLSEIMGGGEAFIAKDRFFRRIGMLSIAKESLKENEKNPTIKKELDAYTNGVNAYIKTLKPADYPLEYKLLNYHPEKWTNLKSQLLLKYMAFDLAGYDSDFEMTNAKSLFTDPELDKLYPVVQDSLAPIIPGGPTTSPSISIREPANNPPSKQNIDISTASNVVIQPDIYNGSNNWAVSGSKTKSGAPILCNDPHLSLTLPSLWYEMQISTPTFSSYGASIPGSPSIIIGFNEHCAWGVTNASRDVKDYYEIKFKDASMKEYWFNNKWTKSSFRYETIKIKGQADKTEKIAVTALGPVMYDKTYPNVLKNGKYYALRWMAQDVGDELLTFNKLNHARNYSDFIAALSTYGCPGQNFVFASKGGDIAIKQQGRFPAKWTRQGDYLMQGTDSTYAWQAYIPFRENPGIYNPENGYVSSANQLAYKSSPYYLAGKPHIYRGITINRMLNNRSQISVKDMQEMQVNNHDAFAEQARPLLVKYLNTKNCSANEISYFKTLKAWNLENNYSEEGPTILDKWWRNLKKDIFDDEFSRTSLPIKLPDNSALLEQLLKDSTFKFVDDINTPRKENLRTLINSSFKKACKELDTAKQENYLAWGRYKNTEAKHVLNIPAFGRSSLPIGGGSNSINAATRTNGPGWRMVVELTSNTNAYGIYAGGQSGNPGSLYYDNFIDKWASGKYYPLLFLKKQETTDNKKLKWKMTFSKT